MRFPRTSLSTRRFWTRCGSETRFPFWARERRESDSRKAGPKFLPSGSELANELADYANFPLSEKSDRGDLSKMSSYLVDGINRDALRRKLRGVFTGANARCTPLHRLLAAVADNLMIVTTNYDTLLEQAFIFGPTRAPWRSTATRGRATPSWRILPGGAVSRSA
jgi:hypothetical protein